MVLELRPSWCLGGKAEEEMFDREEGLISLGDWIDQTGKEAFSRNGDDWRPGEFVTASRVITLRADAEDLRRQLKFSTGSTIGAAVRWVCRATATAGTHSGGPTPVVLSSGENTLTVEIPSAIARSVEIETCLIVNWDGGRETMRHYPDGAMIWSDSWATPQSQRLIILEGDQLRIPVNSVSFRMRFGESDPALWFVEVDPAAELHDLVINAVSVLINADVLARDFLDADGSPEAGLLTDTCLAGIQVDLVSCLTALLENHLEINDSPHWGGFTPGTVGHLVNLRLTEAFGSVPDGLREFRNDRATFSRKLWGRFAPGSWRK